MFGYWIVCVVFVVCVVPGDWEVVVGDRVWCVGCGGLPSVVNGCVCSCHELRDELSPCLVSSEEYELEGKSVSDWFYGGL